MNPDIIVWSETALPWTFRTDDDLLTRVLQITYPANAGHILGILSEADDDPSKVYNSVYYIEPDGRVTSRYDKVDLLSFIEKPLLDPSFRVPFLSEGIHHNAPGWIGHKTASYTLRKYWRPDLQRIIASLPVKKSGENGSRSAREYEQ
jgi:apolipoprotein N-acyltransferase